MFLTILLVVLIVLGVTVYLHNKNVEEFRGGRGRGGRGRGGRGRGGRRGGRGSRRAHRAFRRHWYRPFRWGGWSYPWNWNGWWPSPCKRGCSYLGNGGWGCQYPGNSPNDCVWASDCSGCAF